MRSPNATGCGGREGGFVLVAILLIVATLLSLGVFGSRSARIEIQIARNHLFEKKAWAVAEAGVHHARSLLKADLADGFDDELGSGGTGGGLASLGSVQTLDGDSYRFRSFGNDPGSGYYLRVTDNFDETTGSNQATTDRDQTVWITSRSVVGSAERRIDTLVQARLGPDCAINVAGNLAIDGNPEVTGSQGCAHANGSLSVPGNPELEAGATSSGGMTISGNPVMEGTTLSTNSQKTGYASSHGSAPQMSIPSVNPLDFGPQRLNLAQEIVNSPAGYRLQRDCKVYQGGTCSTHPGTPVCSGGTLLTTINGSGSWNGWTCKSDSSSTPASEWSVSGNTSLNGLFFVEGWVKISGNPGTESNPWRATIVAMNSIDVSGNPHMTAYSTTGSLRNILFVAGNDLAISGNPENPDIAGGLFAHQQLKVSGNPVLRGFVIVENGASTWTADPAPNCNSGKDLHCGSNQISGNMTLEYGGLDTAMFPIRLDILAWKPVGAD